MKFEYRQSLWFFVGALLLCPLLAYGSFDSAFDGRQMSVLGVVFDSYSTGIIITVLGVLFSIATILILYILYIVKTSDRYIKIDENGIEFPPYPWKKEYRCIALDKFKSVRPLSARGIEFLEFTHDSGKITIQKNLFKCASDYEAFIEEADKWFSVQ